DIDGAGDAVAPPWNEDDAFLPVGSSLVDGGLEGGAVIGLAVAHGPGEGNCPGIVQPGGQKGGAGLAQRRDSPGDQQKGGEEELSHRGKFPDTGNVLSRSGT